MGRSLSNRLDICTIAALTLLLAVGCGRGPVTRDFERSADRNILVITIDTLRSDAISCAGGQARTPNIDGLATNGVRFTFAHAHAVVTLPSHASILTGRYPFEHGIRENSGFRLDPGSATLATALKAAGFSTAAFVGAFPLDARFGLTSGFDVYDGHFDPSPFAAEFIIPERPATVVVSRANAWIAQQPRRWFAWVHLYEPHAPYRPPPPFDREYAAQPYYGEVAAADAALGPLLETARGSPRSTLVVVTGDHGEGLGEHGETTHGLFAYESTLRIPLIISELGTPGVSRPAEISDAPARHIDIVPTILDALQLPAPGNLQGHSLRTAADRVAARDRASYFEAMSGSIDYGWAPLDGIVVGHEKYINLPMAELYDVAKDGREEHNLLPSASERGRTLAARLSAFNARQPGAPRQESADVARGLQALGYVSGGSRSASRPISDDDDPKRLVDLDRLMHDAVARAESGQLPEAITEFRQVLTRRPDMIAASRHLAFAYWRNGDRMAAIETLRASLKTGGTAAAGGATVQLGSYLTAAGQTGEAIEVLKRTAANDPTTDALDALGLAYARAGRTADAVSAFSIAIRLEPERATTYENIGAVELDAGHVREAGEYFARAITLDPTSSQAHAGAAMAAERSGDAARAIAEWTMAVRFEPSNFEALYDLGVALAREQRTAQAKPYLDQFVRTAPRDQYAREIGNASKILAQIR